MHPAVAAANVNDVCAVAGVVVTLVVQAAFFPGNCHVIRVFVIQVTLRLNDLP